MLCTSRNSTNEAEPFRSSSGGSRSVGKSVLIVALLGTAIVCRPIYGDSLPTTASWTDPFDGLWSDASKWSTDPCYPDNDSPNAGDAYEAIIDAVGSAYTVTLDRDVSVDRLTLTSPGAVLLQTGGTFSAADGIDLQDGTFRIWPQTFADTAIADTTIVGNGGQLEVVGQDDADATFRNLVLDVDTVVGEASNLGHWDKPKLTIEGGLDITAGRTMYIESGGRVTFSGDQTIGGSGEIVVYEPNPSRPYVIMNLTSGSTLTIGPDVTLRCDNVTTKLGRYESYWTDNTIINEGVITGSNIISPAGMQDGLEIQPGVFENRGLVEAAGSGRVMVGGDWTNLGVLRLRDTATLELGGTFTVADIGTLQRDGGTLRISGVLDNRGTTITANAATGSVELGAHTAYAEILGGTVSAADGQKWIVPGNVLMDGVVLAGDVDVTGGSLMIRNEMTLADSTVRVSPRPYSPSIRLYESGGDQTLAGRGRVVFADGGRVGVTIPVGSTFTIGPDIVFETSGADVEFNGTTLVNQGVIRAAPGDRAEIEVTEILNSGTLQTAGRMILGRRDDSGLATWRNEGTIVVQAGGQLTLNGQFTPDDLGTVVDEGAQAVYLSGTLDLSGRTLDLESLQLGVPLTMYEGAIKGGRLTTTGDASLGFVSSNNAGLFDGVTLDMDLEIPNGSGLRFINDLILNDCTITVWEGARFVGSQTLGGQGVILAPNRPATAATITIGGDSLTIGEGITIRNGTQPYSELTVAFSENHGTIIAEAPNTKVNIAGDYWANRGVLRVDGGSLVFTDDYSVDSFGTIERLRGDVILEGRFENTGRTLHLNADTGSWQLHGTMTGGCLETADGARLVIGRSATLDGVTVAGEVFLDAGLSTSSAGVETRIENNLHLDGGAIVLENDLSKPALLSFPGVQSIDGAGEIILNGAYDKTCLQTYNGSVLTIEDEVIVRTGPNGSGTISPYSLPVINRGTISAQTPGKPLIVGGTLTNTGTMQAVGGGLLEIRAEPWSNEGRLHVDGGRIHIQSDAFTNGLGGVIDGTGDVELTSATLVNDGMLAPSVDGSGALRITGNLTLGADSVFRCELDGSDHGQIHVTGDVDLGGILGLDLLGVGPPGASTRPILTAAGGHAITGTFAQVPPVHDPLEGPAGHLEGGVFHRGVQYAYPYVLVDLYTAIGGDGNGDGNVDDRDANNLADRFSRPEEPSDRTWTDNDTAGGDTGRGDGRVNGDDISDVLIHWTVPDPGPLPEGTAMAKYNPSSGQLSISVHNVMNWVLRSDAAFLDPTLAEFAHALPAGQGTFVSSDMHTIGEGGFDGLLSYQNVALGQLVEPGTDPDALTLEFVTGFGGSRQRGTIAVVPEPGTLISLIIAAATLLRLIRRRFAAAPLR